MTKLNKIYSQIVNNPKDVNFYELDKLLKQHGFNCRKSEKRLQSLHILPPRFDGIALNPKTRPIKAIYVKQAIAAIERLKERSGS